jgi:hypothetical protein
MPASALGLARTPPDTEAPYRSLAEATDFLRLVAEITANIATRNASDKESALGAPCHLGGGASASDDRPGGDGMSAACIRPAEGA